MKKKNYLVALSLLMAVSLSMMEPTTVEAASKKPAVKSVTLNVGGKKVNSKTVTVNKGSKIKVSVIVNPTKAKKSVKWSKLSKKQKKIATMKGNTITAKKNGTIKLTVRVKGKNGKTKSAWLKVKVVTPSKKKPTTTTKPSTPTTKPSTPSTPSTPSKPTVTPKSYTIIWRGLNGKVDTQTATEGTILNISTRADNTCKDNSLKFNGWYDDSVGGNKITTYKVTESKTFYARWVSKDPMTDWVFNPVSADVTLLASEEIYNNDGIKTYKEVVGSYMGEAWVQCECGETCQFKVKDHKGNIVIVDHCLYVVSTNKYYVLTKDVKTSRTVSSDWAFLDITSAFNKACNTTGKDCKCSTVLNIRMMAANNSINYAK